ncbi:MAG: endonuclease/exonuclease/phosphatase family protein [Hylemonella sp.]|jgi:hypothetical protein|nr:endonuclease/exonuclease/phosphatase family protein [Hylemonella sp.]
MTFKLATWNLQLPVADSRRKAIRSHTDQENADIWVLTETHDGFSPGHEFHNSSLPGRDGGNGPGHRWVTIWSKQPLEALETGDKKRTAAVRVFPANAAPYLVYGTVLPWKGDKWEGHPSAGGVAFQKALELQLQDWTALQRAYPEDEFFLLGDLNQDLVSRPRYYGSLSNRRALEVALATAGLMALTGGDKDPIRRNSHPCACIDHICAKTDSRWKLNMTSRWPNGNTPDRKLSDHFGVAAELSSA